MLLLTRKPWFKICSVVTAAVTLFVTTDAMAGGDARRQAAPRLRLDDVARTLGFDPASVRDGEGYAAAERARAGERRRAALAGLQARLAVDSMAAERVRRARADIEQAHLPDLLAGAARTARELGERARAGRAGVPELERTATILDQAISRTRRDAIASPLGPSLEKAARLNSALRSGAGLRDLARLAPSGRAEKRPVVRPSLGEDMDPPAPRRGPRLGNDLTSEQRWFYASVLDAPGLEVESAFGRLDPTSLVAGGRPEVQVAALNLEAALSLVEGALAAPDAPDLALTGEVRASAEMRALVERLHNDPLALFNFVHDETDAEIYYGAKKGSVGAFEERAGNDADLASLLVTLLRLANVPARYEYGTVEITPEQAMAWAGTTDVTTAADALRSSGIPTTKIMDGATVSAVRIEHMWVRAYVPYSNYRGVARPGSRSMWIRLDPSLKRAQVRPALDLRGKVTFDYDGYLATVSGETAAERYEAQLRDWIRSSGVPCKTLEDAIPARERLADALPVLPAELPAVIVSSLATFSGIPASMRASAKLSIGEWAQSVDLPSVYGSALTLRYRGATAAADQVIAAAGGIAHLSRPATAQIVPTLTVDSVEVARGSAALPGTEQELVVALTIPHAAPQPVRHQILAGSVFAIGFPVGHVPEAVVARREAELTNAVASGVTGDDLEAARGNRALWRYFWHVDREEDRVFALEWMRAAKTVSEAIAGRELDADLLYGTPVRVRPGRFTIDVPRYSIMPYAVDGGAVRRAETARVVGYNGSAREHLIWEETVHVPAISTVRILQVARSQGLAVRRFTAENASLISTLPYSAASIQDITDKVHAGLVVSVPERPVVWGRYVGYEGYVVEDPLTGASDFRLQGLYSGGGAEGVGAPDGKSCPVCSAPEDDAASRVSLALGNMYFSETDLAVQARGIPVAFTRRYDSMSPHGGRLGPGWMHSYEVRLLPQPDGSVLLVNDAFRTQRFSRNEDGTYAVEPGYHEMLRTDGDGWRLAFKDGAEYQFRADGQLGWIQDLNGHLLQLRYSPDSRLEAVVDATQREALTFAYDAAGSLAAVSDASGRTVQFGHDRGDLVSATDVLGGVQRYGYDSGHRLAWKQDRNGNTTTELYDGEGRWIGGIEPDGKGRSVSYDMVNRRAVHVDKLGNARLWEYNANGNPTAVTDALGNRRTMEWNDRHEKVAEVDARGARTELSYDEDGNLLVRRDASGAMTSYTYDARGRVLTATDPLGKVSRNEYDASGNLVSATDPAGAVTAYTYTSDGLPETIAQPGGATTSLAYDADGSVRSVTDPEGGRTELTFDAFGHLSSIKDALGNARTMEMDAAGRVLSISDAAGGTTTFEYDAQGNRTAAVDAAGGRTSFGYDALGRLVSVTDASGHVTTTEYDAEGQVTARVDALGRRTVYRYDAAGRLVETEGADGAVTTQGYCGDASSQPCAVVDPLGGVTQVTLDALGRPVSIVDPNGRQSNEAYDAAGRRISSRDSGGAETIYSYDETGRLMSVTDPAGGVTAYGYDGRGNRISVTDANGKTTSFEYDRANRLVSEATPIGTVTRYTYDPAGNRATKLDGNGQLTEYGYDANRRLRTVRFADGTSYEYEYDAAGNRTRMAVDTGEVVQYRWDAAGRLLEEVDAQGASSRFSYDLAGRRTRVAYGNGTSATYQYDALGQGLSIVYADRAGQVQTAFGYGYDASGNRLWKAFADGTRETYGYDALNRLVSADYPDQRHVEYGYDPVGNRVTQLDNSRPATVWATTATASSQHSATAGAAAGAVGPPDQTGCQRNVNKGMWWPRTPAQPATLEVGFGGARRATGLRIAEQNVGSFVMRVDLIDEGGGAHTVFEGGDRTACAGMLRVSFGLTEYAVKGARIYVNTPSSYAAVDAVGLDVPGVETYEYNGFNQLLTMSGNAGSRTEFQYDGNGNQTRKTETPAGGAAQVTQYVYNPDNRLVGIALPSGVSNAFEYDANGLRTKKTDSSGTTSYLLDGMSVIAQYAPGGARQAWYTQSLARIDEVLSVVNGQGKFWYQADALGSAYALANGAGQVVARGGYDVFGEPQAISGNVSQPFGFTGREHERDSGLVYQRLRFNSPRAGAFLSPDIDSESVSRSGGAQAETGLWRTYGGAVPYVSPLFGRYSVDESNPVLNRDPTGLALEMVNRGSVIYTGFGLTVPWWPGGAGGFGAVFGFFGQPGTFGGMSSALALTFGVAFHGHYKIGVSLSVDFGMYWGLRDACDYAGPFATLGGDIGGGFGLSLVFSVKTPWPDPDSFWSQFDGPVGITLSASSPRLSKYVSSDPDLNLFVGSSPISFTMTESELYNVWGCSCR